MKITSILYRLAAFYLIATLFLLWGIMIGRFHVFPHSLIKPVYSEIALFIKGSPYDDRGVAERLQLHRQMRKNEYPYIGFQLRDKNFVDPGYLLLSRFSKAHSQVIVELMRLSDRKILHTWIPPIQEIIDRGGIFDLNLNSESGYCVRHPMLLDDGSLVFTSGEGPLARIDKHNNILWVIPKHFHHSIERLQNGNLIVPINIQPSPVDYPWLRNDGYAIVSPEGEVLEQQSVAGILIRNGYHALLLGIGNLESDRIHLNDAQPIYRDAGVAKAGDIAMSSRELSTVFLYRPSTDKVIWLKTGPWIHQHDVNIVNTDSYSIFGNDAYDLRVNPTKMRTKFFGDSSQIYLYNPTTDEVSTPFASVLKSVNMKTLWQGRSRILANGDVFIEETIRHRLMRISKDTVRWEYVNGESLEYTGTLNWCRYLNPDEFNHSWME